MDDQAFQEYLENRYYKEIGWYDKKAVRNQKAYRGLQFGLIVLSSLTPVLIVAENLKTTEGSSWFFWIPALTATVVAILSSTIKTFQFHEKWISYRTTCETLRKEIHFYNAGIWEYAEADDREALFFERVESLISRENTIWLASQKPDKKP